MKKIKDQYGNVIAVALSHKEQKALAKKNLALALKQLKDKKWREERERSTGAKRLQASLKPASRNN